MDAYPGYYGTCYEKPFKNTLTLSFTTCNMGIERHLISFYTYLIVLATATSYIIDTNQIDNYQCVDSYGHSNMLIIILYTYFKLAFSPVNRHEYQTRGACHIIHNILSGKIHHI